MTHEKLIDKARKIHAMAEGAKAIGSEAEAQAFADALQRLMLEHKIEMTDLEFEEFEKEEPVDKYYIDYSKYPDVKIQGNRLKWIQTLAGVVARAHFCRILVHQGSRRITLVGRKQDCQMAEFMFITLYRAANNISKIETKKFHQECKATGKYKGMHGSFRESWIEAFVTRLFYRFDELRRSKEAQSTALVRFNRSDAAVDKWFKDQEIKSASALSTTRAYHQEGVRRGTAAANQVNLTPNVLNQESGAKKLIR